MPTGCRNYMKYNLCIFSCKLIKHLLSNSAYSPPFPHPGLLAFPLFIARVMTFDFNLLSFPRPN